MVFSVSVTLRLDPLRNRKDVCPDKRSFLADSDEHFTIKAGDQSGKDKINKQQEVNMNICVIILKSQNFTFVTLENLHSVFYPSMCG